MPVTVEELAAGIRQKHPNDGYDKVGDAELVRAWVKKFPEYKSALGGAEPGGDKYAGKNDRPIEPKYEHGADFLNTAGEKLKEAGKGIATQAAAIGPISMGTSGGDPQRAAEAGKNLPEIVKAPGRELFGMPQPGKSVLTAPQGVVDRVTGAAVTALGGDAGAAREAKAEGRTGAEYANLATVPAVGAVLGLTGLGPKKVSTAPTREEIASLQSLMGRTSLHAPPVEAAERTAELQTMAKQATQELGLTDQNIAERLPSRKFGEPKTDYVGDVVRGNDVALKISKQMVDIADRPLSKIMETFGDQKVPQVSETISQALDKLAVDEVDPGVKRALQDLSVKVRSAKTVHDLNEIKVHANKEIDAIYSNTPGKEINASAQTAYAYKLTADEIRNTLYPELERMSGGTINLKQMGMREADAIAFRDGVHDLYYHQIAPQQATREALSFGQYVFGEGPEHSLYTRHVIRRSLESKQILPGPAGMFNKITRKGIGPVGKGFKPETVNARNLPQLQLPGGTEPYSFTIPGNLPEEVVTGGKGVTKPNMEYAGQEEVPNSSHTPVTGGSRYRQRLDLGTTEGTIPERTFNRSEGQVRADEVGMDQTAARKPSFAGPESKTRSRWQYLTSSSEPTETRAIEGQGTLHTTDAKMAEETLKRLQDYAAEAPPEEAPRIRAAIKDLHEQLKRYRAYQGSTPPKRVSVTPAKRGQRTLTPLQRAKRPVGIAAKVGAAKNVATAPTSLPRIDNNDEDEE